MERERESAREPERYIHTRLDIRESVIRVLFIDTIISTCLSRWLFVCFRIYSIIYIRNSSQATLILVLTEECFVSLKKPTVLVSNLVSFLLHKYVSPTSFINDMSNI